MTRSCAYLIPLLVALTACGDGDQNTFSGCAESFASKKAIPLTITSSPACTIRDLPLAVDGERDSFASMTFPAAGCAQDIGFSVWAQPPFSGGNVGAIVRLPDNVAPGAAVTLITRLDGEEQDSSLLHGGTRVTDVEHSQDKYYSFQTRLPFDSLELTLHLTGSVGPGTVRIYEVCAHR